MLLSALFVHFRDIQPIWEVIAQILFYASPVIISIETVTKAFHSPEHKFLMHHQYLLHVYMLNPLAVIFQQFRHAMVTNADAQRRRGAGQLDGAFGRAGDRGRPSSWSASRSSTAPPPGSRRISKR